MTSKDSALSTGELVAMFAGDSKDVLSGMREHFAWLAEGAAREHDPATDWDRFVDRLWRSAARWAGWVEDGRDWEGVKPPWFATKDDPKVVTWYDEAQPDSLSS